MEHEPAGEKWRCWNCTGVTQTIFRVIAWHSMRFDLVIEVNSPAIIDVMIDQTGVRKHSNFNPPVTWRVPAPAHYAPLKILLTFSTISHKLYFPKDTLCPQILQFLSIILNWLLFIYLNSRPKPLASRGCLNSNELKWNIFFLGYNILIQSSKCSVSLGPMASMVDSGNPAVSLSAQEHGESLDYHKWQPWYWKHGHWSPDAQTEISRFFLDLGNKEWEECCEMSP